MVTSAKQTDEKVQIKRYKVQYSIEEYTFPKDAYIHAVRFDENFMRVALTDQRELSIPLWWIPTVYNASTKDREKFEISQDRTMIIWDPEKTSINDEINIADYLGPVRNDVRTVYTPNTPKRRVAERKSKSKKK
jgi:hypothetical protein